MMDFVNLVSFSEINLSCSTSMPAYEDSFWFFYYVATLSVDDAAVKFDDTCYFPKW